MELLKWYCAVKCNILKIYFQLVCSLSTFLFSELTCFIYQDTEQMLWTLISPISYLRILNRKWSKLQKSPWELKSLRKTLLTSLIYVIRYVSLLSQYLLFALRHGDLYRILNASDTWCTSDDNQWCITWVLTDEHWCVFISSLPLRLSYTCEE